MRSWLNGYDASHNTGGDSGIDYTSDNFIGTAFSAKEQAAIADTEVFNDDTAAALRLLFPAIQTALSLCKS